MRMVNGKIRYCIIMVCVVVIAACTPQVPSKYIQPDEMEDILYDYHMTQAMANQEYERISNSFKQSLFYHSVLQKHGVTEAELDTSLVYYYTHTDRLAKIYSRISKRMEDEAMRLGATVGDINKYSKYAADGDTANVWNETTSLILTPHPPYNRYSFSVIPDSTYKKGDTFLFQFYSDFLIENGTKEAYATLVFTYESDSLSTHSSYISSSGMSQLKVICDSHKFVKEIRGFIYLSQGEKNAGLKLLFVDRIQLIRFHKTSNSNEETKAKKELLNE